MRLFKDNRYLARFLEIEGTRPVFGTECVVPEEDFAPYRIMSRFVEMDGPVPVFAFEGSRNVISGKRFMGRFVDMDNTKAVFGVHGCGPEASTSGSGSSSSSVGSSSSSGSGSSSSAQGSSSDPGSGGGSSSSSSGGNQNFDVLCCGETETPLSSTLLGAIVSLSGSTADPQWQQLGNCDCASMNRTVFIPADFVDYNPLGEEYFISGSVIEGNLNCVVTPDQLFGPGNCRGFWYFYFRCNGTSITVFASVGVYGPDAVRVGVGQPGVVGKCYLNPPNNNVAFIQTTTTEGNCAQVEDACQNISGFFINPLCTINNGVICVSLVWGS